MRCLQIIQSNTGSLAFVTWGLEQIVAVRPSDWTWFFLYFLLQISAYFSTISNNGTGPSSTKIKPHAPPKTPAQSPSCQNSISFYFAFRPLLCYPLKLTFLLLHPQPVDHINTLILLYCSLWNLERRRKVTNLVLTRKKNPAWMKIYSQAATKSKMFKWTEIAEIAATKRRKLNENELTTIAGSSNSQHIAWVSIRKMSLCFLSVAQDMDARIYIFHLKLFPLESSIKLKKKTYLSFLPQTVNINW